MLKTLHEEIGTAPAPRRAEDRRRCRSRGCAGRRAPAARATIPSRRTFVSRTRLNKPGSEKETWHIEFDLAGCGLDYTVGDAFGLFPTNDPALADAVIARARRAGRFPDRRPHAARGADRRRLARARARHAVPADLLHHRRRAAAEGQGARGRRGPGRRCRDARRAGGDREILRRAARSGSLHRGARSAAAAALFDLVVAEGAIRGRVSLTRRYRALRHRQAQAARRRLDLPRRAASSPATSSRSTCRRRTPSACRPIRRCRSS